MKANYFKQKNTFGEYDLFAMVTEQGRVTCYKGSINFEQFNDIDDYNNYLAILVDENYVSTTENEFDTFYINLVKTLNSLTNDLR